MSCQFWASQCSSSGTAASGSRAGEESTLLPGCRQRESCDSRSKISFSPNEPTKIKSLRLPLIGDGIYAGGALGTHLRLVVRGVYGGVGLSTDLSLTEWREDDVRKSLSLRGVAIFRGGHRGASSGRMFTAQSCWTQTRRCDAATAAPSPR